MHFINERAYRRDRVRAFSLLLQKGQVREIAHAAYRRVYSNTVSLGLRRDLTTPFEAPKAGFPLTVRPLRDEDVPRLIDLRAPGLTGEEVRIQLNRLHLVRENFPTCFVAITLDGTPCYMQWLIGQRENARIRAYFHDLFPPLGAGDVLLEGAFTPPQYRGHGIMACAMAQIAEEGNVFGAHRAMTFVAEDNRASLRGCQKAGFIPFLRRYESWRLFRSRYRFTPWT